MLIVQYFAVLQPLLQRAIEIFPEERLCEKVCRCYKYVMKTTSRAFAKLVPAMAENLVNNFKRLPYSAFIYAAAICFSCFIKEEPNLYGDILYNMLWSVSESFFTVMHDYAQFEKKPDLVEEYFYFVGRVLELHPEPFIYSQYSATIIQAGITGLQIRHKEAQKGILSFFEKLIQVCMVLKDSTTQAIISECAGAVIDSLIKSLTGFLPAYALDENNGCIGDVLWNIRQANPIMFKVINASSNI
jgi:transportin-3